MGSSWKEMAIDLHGRCLKAVARYPDFALDVIELWPVRKVSARTMAAFVRRQFGHPPAVECEFVTDTLVARFHGDLDGYDEFQRLGHEMYGWLRSTDPQLPEAGSYLGWVGLLNDMTQRCPAVGFELKPESRVLELDDIPVDAEALHTARRYIHSPFEISCTALRMFIEPYETRFMRAYSSKVHLFPWQLACVFANPRITQLTPAEIVAFGLENAMAIIECGVPYKRPRFFRGPNFSGKLSVGGRLVRKVSAGSTALFAVLNEFERNEWPEEIETAKTPGLIYDNSARTAASVLNTRQHGPLRIHFTAPNSGRRICWEIVAPEQ